MPQIGLIGGGWIDIHIHSALRADEAHDPQSCVQKQGAPVLDPFKMVMVSCHVAAREGGREVGVLCPVLAPVTQIPHVKMSCQAATQYVLGSPFRTTNALDGPRPTMFCL